ncbi:hypothetical protein C8F01DRAFT_1085959 [Mycena amicta]|nr:hypothetical protein C8F01DRAFT_1085959 [Mycena amicta]
MILPKDSPKAAEANAQAAGGPLSDAPPAYEAPQSIPTPAHIKPTNYVSISRRAGEIKETFVLDPAMRLPQSMGSTPSANQPHFELSGLMGVVNVEVFIVASSATPVGQGGKTRLRTWTSMGETKLTIHAPSRRAPLDISVRTSLGAAKLLLPRSFRGRLRMSTTLGEAKLSKELQAATTRFGNGLWFVGEWNQEEVDETVWPGDEAIVQTTMGEAFVGYDDEQPEKFMFQM